MGHYKAIFFVDLGGEILINRVFINCFDPSIGHDKANFSVDLGGEILIN